MFALEVKPGQRVAQADALMRLADTRTLWLDIEVPADRRGQLQSKGGEIMVMGRDVMATPSSIGSMVSDSQTVILRAQVMRGAERLRVGEYVQAQVPFANGVSPQGASAREGWPVPVQAVARQGDKAYVFVRTPKGFVAQAVNVLTSSGQQLQVQGQLASGQEIAVSSVIALKAAWLGKSGGE